MPIFAATSTNLSGLGGPMGSDSYTSMNWTKFYRNLKAAQKACLADYAKHRPGESFKWESDGRGVTSGDLLFVMYDIQPIKIEREGRSRR